MEKELADLKIQIEGQLQIIQQTQTESSKLNTILSRADFTNINQTESEITHIEGEARRFLEINAAVAKEYDSKSDDDIKRFIADLELQKKNLEAQTIVERIKAASVIGMTLDCHIGRFFDQFIQFDHIFLDEAGYAPAVKALTLCRGGVPLTFIGDHKQLGPVCEMNDENLGLRENNPALIWKKSALFIDDLFTADSGAAVINEWLEFPEPQLRRFTKTQLNTTFRFGQNLADILSECVYGGMNFISAAPHEDLKIICLNAVPDVAPTQPRQNRSEAEAIEMYLRELPEQQEEAEGTYVALAPYKNQVGLLTHQLDEARRQGRIMTIHKSQGREWDAVILSVVDGHFNNPWFTDTINPQSGGLHVMNTAVSRARKHLIIVCNLHYWKNRPDAEWQLISRLIAGS